MTLTPVFGSGHVHELGSVVSPRAVSRSWLHGKAVFDHRRWRCDHAEMTWVAPYHLVVLTQRGGTRRTRVTPQGHVGHDGRDRPGTLSFIPAGTTRHGFYQDVDLVYAALWFSPDLACLSAGGPDLPELVINGSDTVVMALLNALQSDLTAGEGVDSGYLEHLLALTTYRLASLSSSRMPIPKAAALGRATLRRVEEYIDANLSSHVGLACLADVAGLGVDSFARRFKATTGLAPYAFILEQRIRRAEELLAHSDVALAGVATRLGFSSQSHFTATFRRHRGTTPLAFRIDSSRIATRGPLS